MLCEGKRNALKKMKHEIGVYGPGPNFRSHAWKKNGRRGSLTFLCLLFTIIVLRGTIGADKFGTPEQDRNEIRQHLYSVAASNSPTPGHLRPPAPAVLLRLPPACFRLRPLAPLAAQSTRTRPGTEPNRTGAISSVARTKPSPSTANSTKQWSLSQDQEQGPSFDEEAIPYSPTSNYLGFMVFFFWNYC
ncbi:hypothetical protein RIF29_15864 [Crotalaria pallida]|uniref:Uncharacterized protein n=1 Tax=Crotalaria pallida TaxID=3830 RepID=A0AAN9IJE5_CROPI